MIVMALLIMNHCCRDEEDYGGEPRSKFTSKLAKIPYITMWQYWLDNTKPKKAFRLILSALKKLLRNFFLKNHLTEFSTD